MSEIPEHPYRRTLYLSAGVQVLLLLLSCTSLDFGEMFTAFAYAGVAYWIAVAMIVRRRPRGPTRGDRIFLRFGLVALSLFSLTVSPVVWMLRGRW